MGKLKDLTGQRFGKLTVIERAEDHIECNGKHRVQWKCLCDCGNTVSVRSSSLTSGNNVSFGCMPKGRKKEI